MNDVSHSATRWRQAALLFLPPGADCHVIGPLSGGFSGADVIGIATAGRQFVLRGTPVAHFDEDQLRRLEHWLRHLAENGLPVAVPLINRSTGEPWRQHGNQLWQMEPWLPGHPVSGEEITPGQLQHLMQTVAQLHRTTADLRSPLLSHPEMAPRQGTPPSLAFRRRLIRDWTPPRLIEASLSMQTAPEPLRSLLEGFLTGFLTISDSIDRELQSLERVAVPLHLCLRDLWSAHVLFTADQVTGVIDPHAARVDHVSTDLSRLLGSLFGEGRARWEQALQLYERHRPLTEEEHRLIRVMDRSSVLLSGMTWVARWRDRQIPASVTADLIHRLQLLESRLQGLCSRENAN